MGYEALEQKAKEMGLPVYQYMRIAAQRAQKLTAAMNFTYHEPDDLRADREACGRRILPVPAVLYGLWSEHHDWEKCVLKHQLSFSGSGWHHHRRRDTDRPQCCAGYIEPQ